jgi:hypothetical protein
VVIGETSPSPDWLSTIFGKELFSGVLSVQVPKDRINQEVLQLLNDLPELQHIWVSPGWSTEEEVKRWAKSLRDDLQITGVGET